MSDKTRKKQVADLPLETILRVAKKAGQKAARDAVSAGRVVTGWEDGQLVEYGPGVAKLKGLVKKPVNPDTEKINAAIRKRARLAGALEKMPNVGKDADFTRHVGFNFDDFLREEGILTRLKPVRSRRRWHSSRPRTRAEAEAVLNTFADQLLDAAKKARAAAKAAARDVQATVK